MKVKKYLLFALLVVMASVFPINAQAAIKIAKKNVKLAEGNAYVLRINGNNAGADVVWMSAKPNLVKIVSKSHNRAVLKALKSGSSVITARVAGKTLKCKVKVTKRTAIPKNLTLRIGEKLTLKTSKAAKWQAIGKIVKLKTAKNKKSAVITASVPGKTTITATSGKKIQKCSVTVIEKDGATMADLREEVKIAFSKAKKAEQEKGEAEQQAAAANDAKDEAEKQAAAAKDAKDEAEKQAAAANDAKDKAEKRAAAAETAKKEAETKAAQSSGNSSSTITVPVASITLSENNLLLDKGKTAFLYASCSPSNATNKTVTWTSSNSAVATVNNGTVLAVGYGDATITATVENVKTTCSVKVIRGGWLDGKELTLKGTQKLPLQIEDGGIVAITLKKYHAEDDSTVIGDYRYELEVKGKLASKMLIEDKGYNMDVFLLLTREDGSNSHRPWFRIDKNLRYSDGLLNRNITIDAQNNFTYTAYYPDIAGDFEYFSITSFEFYDQKVGPAGG